jgi:hypothetical protein
VFTKFMNKAEDDAALLHLLTLYPIYCYGHLLPITAQAHLCALRKPKHRTGIYVKSPSLSVSPLILRYLKPALVSGSSSAAGVWPAGGDLDQKKHIVRFLKSHACQLPSTYAAHLARA